VYDARSLKPRIVVTASEVECPVRGCPHRVARQRRSFRVAPRFQCPDHGIAISPTTFEYPAARDNLLWNDAGDLALLGAIMGSKRESRMARERSEDALSWNVFRYLERSGHLRAIVSRAIGRDPGPLQLVYWSYAPAFGGAWPWLAAARQAFGELPQRGSEPDLVAYSERAVLLIEAKFTAGNRTSPSSPASRPGYETGGGAWYGQVFRSPYEAVAEAAEKYELMRFWLLGSWIAARTGRDFALVNLVRAETEGDVERAFGAHIQATSQRVFRRVTWEGLYHQIAAGIPPSAERDRLLGYLAHKSAGYDRFGALQRAFSIEERPSRANPAPREGD
jgi:hypothetical protein